MVQKVLTWISLLGMQALMYGCVNLCVKVIRVLFTLYNSCFMWRSVSTLNYQWIDILYNFRFKFSYWADLICFYKGKIVPRSEVLIEKCFTYNFGRQIFKWHLSIQILYETFLWNYVIFTWHAYDTCSY